MSEKKKLPTFDDVKGLYADDKPLSSAELSALKEILRNIQIFLLGAKAPNEFYRAIDLANKIIIERIDNMSAEKKSVFDNVVTVTLRMREEYVSCITCDLCYSANEGRNLPIYCQSLNTPIDPRDIHTNMTRARSCHQYWPYQISRISKVGDGDEK